MIRRETKTFGFCCGLGGGAKGFKKAASRVGNMIAIWKCIGGIDADTAAARDCLIMPERRNGALRMRGRHWVPRKIDAA
ncbi:hypothetical protein [Cupriavidus sp. PET2-C1]